MSRKHQIQGQSVFYTGCFSKLLMRHQQLFSYPDYLLSGFSSIPSPPRAGAGASSAEASPSPAGCLVPVCPSHSLAQTPAAGRKPEQGQNGTGCNEKRQSIQPVAAWPSPRRFAPAHEDMILLAVSLSPRCVPSCPPWGSARAACTEGCAPLSSTLQDRFLFSCWQEGPETLQKQLGRSDRCCPHLCVYPRVPVLPGAG